jgi:hypothetical protein
MRRCCAVVVVVGLGMLAGCFSAPAERSTARLHAPAFTGLVGDDVVFLDVAVIERLLGDGFVNYELWREADEQTVRGDDDEPSVSLERKTVLEKNGFRIGQIGGLLPPAKLQDLLLSRRNCEAHRVQLHAGHETTIPLGPLWPHCCYQLAHDGQEATAVDLQKAQCLLEVTPSLDEDGRIRLRFTPRIKHGELKTAFTPLRDAAGVLRWGKREQQPEEVYSWLSWTVTAAANEYVVIGANRDKGETLGEQFFLSGEEQPAVQRLLVLRTAHVPTSGEPTAETLGRSPPLALRASLTAARGSGE